MRFFLAADGMERVKESAKETAKDAYEKAKQGVQGASSYMPTSKEEVESSIPGKDSSQATIEVLKEQLEKAKQAMEEKTRETAENVRANGNDGVEAGYTDKLGGAFDGVKDKISGSESDKDTMDVLKEKLEKAKQAVEEKTREAASYIRGKDTSEETEYAQKLGEMLDGVKERLMKKKSKKQEGGIFSRKVQEFCNWFMDGGYMNGGGGDVVVSIESYRYLMQSAAAAIDGAREVFERAVKAQGGSAGGGEWREKYKYLAESAKGALGGAMDVFERAAGGGRKGGGYLIFGDSGGAGMAEQAKKKVQNGFRPVLRALYLAAFCSVYGTSLWMTFVSGYVLSKALPRQQLALLQSKLFPAYLRMATLGVALCFGLHAALHPWPSADPRERLQYWNLGFSLATSLLNALLLEPATTKVVFEKLKLEKEEGRGQSSEDFDEQTKSRLAAIDAKLKGLHAWSSYLNLANVSGLSWHLWYLANRLVV